jgi:ribosomal protein S18 acetylase RimI-like enzyme
MHLFRKSLDINQAHVRPATESDYYRIGGLLREAGRRYYGISGSDLPLLLATVPAVVLGAHHDVWGVAISGWRARRVTWLRCLAIARGLRTNDAIARLMPALHDLLRARDIQHMFYAGDETADTWLIPALRMCGYVDDTTVIVYEKHNMKIPDQGNQAISIRRVRSSDLSTLVDLDQRCFEAHWTMNESALSAAMLEQEALFVVAELHGRLVGYAYASSHFSGRLVHLVRIAVNPRPRHEGVGVRLLAEVIAYARQQHADIVTLNTQSYNEAAQRLYRWFGFAPNGEYQTVLRYDIGST